MIEIRLYIKDITVIYADKLWWKVHTRGITIEIKVIGS
jgi:hypothetical protein